MSKFSAPAEELPFHFLEAYQKETPENVALFAAAEKGDGAEVKALLERGAYANWFEEARSGGMTAVHVAARAESSDALDALLAFEAAEEAYAPRFDLKSTASKSSPLHEAAQAGAAANVALLLAGHDRCRRPEANWPLLLVAPGVAIDGVNAYGDTALALACAANSSAAAKVLLDAAADPRAANARGQRPLHLAVAGVAAALRRGTDGDAALDVVKLLLAEKADPNAPDGHGQTPLHHVAAMRETEATVKLAKLLLANKAQSKIRDANGQRPSELGANRATPRGELKALLKSHERLIVDSTTF